MPSLTARISALSDWIHVRYSRRTIYIVSTLVVVTGILFALFSDYLGPYETDGALPPDTRQSAPLRAADLMARPLASPQDQRHMPKLIHQSWKDDELPPKMQRWSRTCRALHPGWQWVLWTDEDNLRMVEEYFPWFLNAYQALPAEITRADAARNMYMYLFGGVYADLDTECLKPLDRLFTSHGTPLSHAEMPQLETGGAAATSSAQTAWFGRMDFDNTDATLQHTIPNAWMAATPGHPVFLLILNRLSEQISHQGAHHRGITAEELTGPIALYRGIEAFNSYRDKGAANKERVEVNPSYDLFERDDTLPMPRIKLLSPTYIYPYAWNNVGKAHRVVCWSGSFGFNSKRCKARVTTTDTYTITYWSHSWNSNLQSSKNSHRL